MPCSPPVKLSAGRYIAKSLGLSLVVFEEIPNATLISGYCTAISSVEDVVPGRVTSWLQ